MGSQSRNQRNVPQGAVHYTGTAIKVIFATIGRLIATIIMVGIITGCIVASVLTVYVLNAIGAEDPVDLEQIKLGYTSIIYYPDKATGEYLPLQQLYTTDGNRIWVDFDDITQHTKDALIAVEDKRFREHQGVDWQRTAGAFVNMLIPIYSSNAGGSTIHQQLIKNVTKDDDYRIDRKVREIFRALNLAQRSSKDQVLETYLNVVSFGAGANGIQAAASIYFGKDAKDLTLAESASIVGITKYPGLYNPFFNPDKNKARQEHILYEMLDQKYITQEEYDEAVKEKLNFKEAEHYEAISATQSYFVDHVINEVISDLMDKKGYTESYATQQIYQAGYRIYTTVDMDIQAHLENIYSTSENFPQIRNEEYPESACVIIDPNGKILGMVGGIGKKTGARTFNRATMAKRHPGSSIKPIGVYALSFEYNQVTWSTIIEDSPIDLAKPGEAPRPWPINYYRNPPYLGNVTVERAIQQSVNTVAVKLAQVLKTQTIYDFLYNELEMHSLVERRAVNGQIFGDRDSLSAMALGGMTDGVTPLEMVGAYQMFVNGGTYTSPYSYTEVRDADGRLILKKDTTPRQVISEDTSVVMNKLLQRVVNASPGTGRSAAVPNMPTGGKTGTSTEDVDQWFIGFTPYYVCQVWLGYDQPNTYDKYGNVVKNTINYSGLSYPPPVLFNKIMAPLHEGLERKEFLESNDVVSLQFCRFSSDIAGPACTDVGTGWYRKSRIPSTCSGRHVIESAEESSQAQEDADAPRSIQIPIVQT